MYKIAVWVVRKPWCHGDTVLSEEVFLTLSRVISFFSLNLPQGIILSFVTKIYHNFSFDNQIWIKVYLSLNTIRCPIKGTMGYQIEFLLSTSCYYWEI